jgi:hypothetical protein
MNTPAARFEYGCETGNIGIIGHEKNLHDAFQAIKSWAIKNNMMNGLYIFDRMAHKGLPNLWQYIPRSGTWRGTVV